MAAGLFCVLVIALLLVVASAQTVEQLTRFSYSGATGPDKWGSLNPFFSACAKGRRQSPVNIVTKEVVINKNLKPLTEFYHPTKALLVNNWFNIGIRCNENVGVLLVDGKNYTFRQLHWHSPSEHRINGVQFPAELHLVHQADDGGFSVVSILYQYDKDDSEDPFVGKIKDSLSKLAKEGLVSTDQEPPISIGTMDTKPFRRKNHKYYRYIGSLSTPPCTEHVIWNVLGKVRTISREQVQALKAPLVSVCKNNSRPAQPLNGRRIELYSED